MRDVLAYLRLIATPYDDVACARVLAAPAWNLEARDLLRLTERAAKQRGATLIDVLKRRKRSWRLILHKSLCRCC